MSMIKTSLTIMAIVTIATGAASMTVKCDYNIRSNWWQTNTDLYRCFVSNREMFQGRVVVDGKEGKHQARKTDADIQAFHLHEGLNTSQFPSNLQRVFPNLIMIDIFNSSLREITTEDLKPFPQLTFLFLENNIIEVINADTFEGNSLLEVVFLGSNNIKHIDSATFSSLVNLRALGLVKNACAGLSSPGSRAEVVELIEKIESNLCYSGEVITTTNNPLSALINEQKATIEQLKSQVKQMEDENKRLSGEIDNLQQHNSTIVIDSLERKVDRVLERQASGLAEILDHLPSASCATLSTKIAALTTLVEALNTIGKVELKECITRRDACEKQQSELFNELHSTFSLSP